MTVVGVGVDMENVDSFRQRSYEDNKEFYSKVFTDAEVEYCLGKQDPYIHFAARFTAKEAYIKAFNGRIEDIKDIEVVSGDGKPTLRCPHGSGITCHLSMTHTDDAATAIVVLEETDGK